MIAIGIDVYPETNIIGYFESIEGLEGENILERNQEDEDSGNTKCKLKLIRGKNFVEFEKNLKKTSGENEYSGNYIYIIDKQNNIKLQYFCYNIEIKEVQVLENNYFNLDLVCNLQTASKGVLEVCKIRINNELTEYNLWKNLKTENRQGWLEVAINLQSKIIDRENLKVEINGDLIEDTDSFYCVIGEAINGPGGYFGRNLDALHDCFRGEFGVKLPFTLNWKNHSKSKENLKEKFNQIIEVFKENNVKFELN
jgi:RNAse (barnase) inhibitor barstar